MVSSKEKTVKCTECHTNQKSRLAGLNDFYMPGRDRSAFVEKAGTSLLILSLLGVFIHGMVRIVSNSKNKRRI
jgi:hypothetical protein